MSTYGEELENRAPRSGLGTRHTVDVNVKVDVTSSKDATVSTSAKIDGKEDSAKRTQA